MNTFSSFIPNKIKTFRDSALPGMNDDIENKVKSKHKLYHHYLRIKGRFCQARSLQWSW